jgi:adenylate cyclase
VPEPVDEPLVPLEDIEAALLGSPPALTRAQVADEAGVPLELAEELWQQLGFPHTEDDDVAFAASDIEALARTRDLIALGILTPDSQAALVRTWGRSFARLAEWQVNLLAEIAISADDPEARLGELMEQVLPRVEELQTYIWRRHLLSAANRLLAQAGEDTSSRPMAVVFVDIVGYTGRSKNLTDHELVDWVEHFEDETTRAVVEVGGRVIKTIGDEILFVTDDARAAAEIGLAMTERGADEEDRYPQVRAGIAYGEVVSRLGDVYGPTVNLASRLTSVARPGTVLVDRRAYEVLSGPVTGEDGVGEEDGADGGTATVELPRAEGSSSPLTLAALIDRASDELAELSPYTEAGDYRFRRMPRRPVKGYSRLEPFVLRRSKSAARAVTDDD